MPTLNEVMALANDGAATKSPLSSPAPDLSLDELTNQILAAAPPLVSDTKANQPLSQGTSMDQLSVLQTRSTGLNSAVRGVLQLGANAAGAFGDFQTAADLNATTEKWFAPEAPNFNEDTGTFAYESVASNAPQLALAVGLSAIPVVGIPLAIASVAIPQYGESRQEILKGTGQDDAYAALLPASINTALDMAVPFKVAKKLGLFNSLKSEVKEAQNLFAKLSKDTAETASVEGLTEVAQWATNLATVRFLNKEEVLGRLNPQEQQEALNNFFGGLFGGGGFGLGASAYGHYKQGQAKIAIQKEVDDIDDLLNRIQEVPEAPSANAPDQPAEVKPNAPQQTESAPIATAQPLPTPQTAPAIPPAAEEKSKPKPLDTVLNKIRYSIANQITTMPEPLQATTIEALQARRDTLVKLIGSIDTDLNMKQLAAPESDSQIPVPLGKNMGLNMGPSVFYRFLLPEDENLNQYSRLKDGTLYGLPDVNAIPNYKHRIPQITAWTDTQEKGEKLYAMGEVINNTLAHLGLDMSTDGKSPITIVIRDMLNKTETDKAFLEGSMHATGDSMIVHLNTKMPEKKQYDLLFHELGHYIALRMGMPDGTRSPEFTTLAASYHDFLGRKKNSKVTEDMRELAAPLHGAQIKGGTMTAGQAKNSYYSSMEEWLAEGFRQALLNRVADGNINLKTEAPSLYNKIEDTLRRLWRMSRKYVGLSAAGAETFQMFVDRALARREVKELEARIEAMTKNQAKQELAPVKEELPQQEKAPEETLTTSVREKPVEKIPTIIPADLIHTIRSRLRKMKDKPEGAAAFLALVPEETTWQDYEKLGAAFHERWKKTASHLAYVEWSDAQEAALKVDPSYMPKSIQEDLYAVVQQAPRGKWAVLDKLRGLKASDLDWQDVYDILKDHPVLRETFPSWAEGVDRWKAKQAEPLADNIVVETLNGLKLKKQAQNVSDVMSVNMGILGDSAVGKFFRSTMTPLQVAEQANNRGFRFGKMYMSVVQNFQLLKTTVVEKADTTLKLWRQQGPEATKRVSKALYVISTKSDEFGRRLKPEELQQVFDELGMTEADIQAWKAIDASFGDILDRMWKSSILEVARTYNPNPMDKNAPKVFRDKYFKAANVEEQNQLIEQYTGQPLLTDELDLNPMSKALDTAEKAISKMREKNYFPRSRLGEYVVRVRSQEEGQEWEGHVAKRENETLGFYAFDTAQEQQAFLSDISKEATAIGLKVVAHKLDSEVFSMMGLPSGIIDQIVREMDSTPGAKLNGLQRELLNDIALQRSPGKRFLRHMTKRRGIAGFSDDAIRVYANYMSSASNHLARSEYAAEMSSVLSEMTKAIQDPVADIAEVNDLNVLKDYFTRHFDYLMKPDNDWATLRAIGFLWYLGFNVKSAAVNLMQTPMVTLPVLSKDIGTAKAAGRLSVAMKDVVAHLRSKTKLPAEELDMFDYMLKANLIDESLVSELAGLGEADALKRLIPGMSAQSVLTKVSWVGGALFRMGEKFNRRTTALASYRIARSDLKMAHEDAIQYAVESIQASQFEYAKFNRPEFMRGKKSVIFLFWQYMQHASYLFFGGKGSRVAKRMWIMALAMAGIEGLPFAQLLMKTIDFGGTAVRELFGVANPKVEVNKMIRELISNVYDRPDDIMKGMSYQWGLGPFHLLRPLGVPVPNVTTEGSLGFGNPVPWFDSFLDPTVNDMDKALGQTAATILGPIGGMMLGVIEALGYSKEEDNWKRWEKTLPVFMKNASQGLRWATQGEETTSNQMQVVQFETPEQRAEVALKTLGFTPTRIDQTRRQMRAAQESVMYYQVRKQMIMDDFWYARQTKDREVIADARQAIRDFNNEVRSAGMPAFIIQGDTLKTSLSQRAKARALSERGLPADIRTRMAQRQAEKLIPITAGE
ncbi:MAG: putative DNA methylase [Siphoviridae sp. ct7UA22]|nr:MAG: putative DNA methylase [Siphoviridae sp. ct7UA22]